MNRDLEPGIAKRAFLLKVGADSLQVVVADTRVQPTTAALNGCPPR
ncbi:MAG: hypothetical protein ABI389_06460 [Rhodanobacter sp.]